MNKEYQKHGYDGLLVVIEGTDGTGKSTQINLLKEFVEKECYGAMVSQWKTSRLMGDVISEAKERNLLNATTFSLLYAADFADRLENNIIPALKAGFVVLLDRYTYTAYVRDTVRGHDAKWVKKLYEYAPEPDLVFYLEMPVEDLLKRIIGTTGLDYYKSGRDIGLSTDIYNSFKIYQTKSMEVYERLRNENGFIMIDASKNPDEVHKIIKDNVKEVLDLGVVK